MHHLTPLPHKIDPLSYAYSNHRHYQRNGWQKPIKIIKNIHITMKSKIITANLRREQCSKAIIKLIISQVHFTTLCTLCVAVYLHDSSTVPLLIFKL